jgi:hypothetical protein
MTQLLLGLLILIVVYIVGWHQIYGQFIHNFYKKYEVLLIWLSVPTTWLTIYATRLLTEYFEGKMWPNRIFTFSIGIIMFTILTTIYFNERLSVKTLTLIALCGLIVTLQVLWK